MLKIVIVCENQEKANDARWYFQEKYGIIPASCFITSSFVDHVFVIIRKERLTVHAIIDLDGNATVKQLQDLIDNKVDYYFVPDIKKLNESKSFRSCNHPL